MAGGWTNGKLCEKDGEPFIGEWFNQFSLNRGIMTVENVECFLRAMAMEDDGSLEVVTRHGRGDQALSRSEFKEWLFGFENWCLHPRHRSVCEDMTRSLSTFLISSSHNTYIAGAQVAMTRPDPEVFARVLKMGARFIEIDVHPGRSGPVVHHAGWTREMALAEVLAVIRANAFVTSSMPLFVNLELGSGMLAQQVALARELRAAFEGMLLPGPQGEFIDLCGPPSDGRALPSPAAMAGKVVIIGALPADFGEELRSLYQMQLYGVNEGVWHARNMGEDDLIGALLDEGKKEFTMHLNDSHLTRVYPKGLRVDSSNFDPCLAWSAGCQVAALNFQSHGRPMWVNQARFRENGWCGLAKRPAYMPGEDTPRVLSVRMLCAAGLRFPALPEGEPEDDYDPYFRLHVEGHEEDRASFQGPVIRNAGTSCSWNHQMYVKLRHPKQAVLLFEVWDKDWTSADDFLGYSAVTVSSLRTGVRSMPLHDQQGYFLPGSVLLLELKWEK
jgi:phosphatidylinositol phospholipase C delta